MESTEFRDAILVLIAGMTIFIILTIFVVLICSATLRKVRDWKTYCDKQFENITKAVNESTTNTSELSDLVKQLNNKLKSQP